MALRFRPFAQHLPCNVVAVRALLVFAIQQLVAHKVIDRNVQALNANARASLHAEFAGAFAHDAGVVAAHVLRIDA